MIVVLSLNTAVDRTLFVPNFALDRVFLAAGSTVTAGGKGLNVARTVRQLGSQVTVVGFLGGAPREFIEHECAEIGIDQRWAYTEGDSRTCVIVADPDRGEQTVVNEIGPMVSEAEVAQLRAIAEDTVHSGDLICISGSAPPGVPHDLYADLVVQFQRQGARVLVDTSGPRLVHALDANPWAVAPNELEAASALAFQGSADDLARRLAGHARHALLTLGADGVAYATGPTLTRIRAPRVPSGNAVASGDAFAAGFLVGVERGLSPVEAVRLGVACGASNASRPEPRIGDAAEIDRLLSEVTTE